MFPPDLEGGGEGGIWRRSELSMQVILDSLYPGGQSIIVKYPIYNLILYKFSDKLYHLLA